MKLLMGVFINNFHLLAIFQYLTYCLKLINSFSYDQFDINWKVLLKFIVVEA